MNVFVLKDAEGNYIKADAKGNIEKKGKVVQTTTKLAEIYSCASDKTAALAKSIDIKGYSFVFAKKDAQGKLTIPGQ